MFCRAEKSTAVVQSSAEKDCPHHIIIINTKKYVHKGGLISCWVLEMKKKCS